MKEQEVKTTEKCECRQYGEPLKILKGYCRNCGKEKI